MQLVKASSYGSSPSFVKLLYQQCWYQNMGKNSRYSQTSLAWLLPSMVLYSVFCCTSCMTSLASRAPKTLSPYLLTTCLVPSKKRSSHCHPQPALPHKEISYLFGPCTSSDFYVVAKAGYNRSTCTLSRAGLGAAEDPWWLWAGASAFQLGFRLASKANGNCYSMPYQSGSICVWLYVYHCMQTLATKFCVV